MDVSQQNDDDAIQAVSFSDEWDRPKYAVMVVDLNLQLPSGDLALVPTQKKGFISPELKQTHLQL